MSTQREHHLYEFGPFRLDTEEGQLLHNGQPVPLTYKALEMLRVLIENSGHVVAKDDFLNKIWPDTFIEEGILTVNIANLRKALGEDRNAHRYIETVPRRGYRFIASVKDLRPGAEIAVKVLSNISVAGEEKDGRTGNGLAHEVTANLSPAPSSKVKWWLRPVTWVAIVMIAGVTVALSYLWIRNKRDPPDPPSVRSVAVLPFKPLISESRDEALELGLADTLITKLSGIGQVVVRPLSSVRKYAGTDQDPIAAGRELQVDAVLDASFQWDVNKKIRVTARMLRVSDGTTIWTDKFDEQYVSMFLAQDVIAERVAAVLTPRLTGQQKRQLAKHYTDSTEAYELYSKGRFFSNKASAEGFNKGLQFFEQAIEKDPTFALAYAGLADSYLLLGERGLLPPDSSWRNNAESAARRSVELDNTLPEAHLALGSALMHDWYFTAAETELKRAMELDPDSEVPYLRYTHFLGKMGRFDQAIANARRAREINPVSVGANSGLAMAFAEAGEYDLAIEQYKKALEIDPNFVPSLAGLAGAYAAKGMYVEAIAACNKAIAVDNSPQRRGQLTQLGTLYARSGHKDEARRVLNELKEQAKKQYIPSYNFAMLHEALGDKDQAMAWLEKAYAERDIALSELRTKGFDSLRSDPRFVDLLRRISAAMD